MLIGASVKDRQEQKYAHKRNAQSKADIDDTKENVMDDLLSAIASSSPENQVRKGQKVTSLDIDKNGFVNPLTREKKEKDDSEYNWIQTTNVSNIDKH